MLRRSSRLSSPLLGTLALILLVTAPGRAVSGGESPVRLSLHGVHRFAAGDDPAWADPAFDDSNWEQIRVPGSAGSQGLSPADGLGWLRIHFFLPSGSLESPLALRLGMLWGADETYLNGAKIGGEGELGPEPVLPYNLERVYPLPRELLREGTENIVALRIQNGVDAWGLVNGPVRIGERSALEAERAERERWFYVADALLGALSIAALVLWALFWMQHPRDRALLYLGAALLGLLYVTVAGSLPFYHAGLLSRRVYVLIPPALTSTLPLSCVAWILFVSGRRYRGFDLLPVAIVASAVTWFVHPSLGINRLLTDAFAVLCASLGIVFAMEMVRAARRDPEDRGIFLACGAGALAVGIEAMATAYQSQPADWTMRYGIFPCYWLVPAFTLAGMTGRLLRTRTRLVELSAQVLSAQAEERRRLSRELHDGVSQDLQAAKLGLQMASRGDLRESGRGHEAAIGLVSQSIDALRAAAQDLRPLQDARSLAESLARYTEILCSRSGVPIEFEDLRGHETPCEVADTPTAEHLYRIAQEAIANALRHGSARRIRVRLRNAGRRTVLEVLDDGGGFDLERAEGDAAGIGLSTMRERAALIGGRCRIDSTDSGTRIAVSIETPRAPL